MDKKIIGNENDIIFYTDEDGNTKIQVILQNEDVWLNTQAIANLQEDLAAEQKARATYEKLIDLCRDNPDVVDPLRFLRQREIVHFQRFGEALRGVQDKLAEKKCYMSNMKVNND